MPGELLWLPPIAHNHNAQLAEQRKRTVLAVFFNENSSVDERKAILAAVRGLSGVFNPHVFDKGTLNRNPDICELADGDKINAWVEKGLAPIVLEKVKQIPNVKTASLPLEDYLRKFLGR